MCKRPRAPILNNLPTPNQEPEIPVGVCLSSWTPAVKEYPFVELFKV
jgi:hypothetical protein